MLEYRRRLPHFQPDDVYVFLTWRLCGSLPANRQRATYPTAGHAFVATDRALDCHRSGPLWLKDPRIAALVVKAIRIGESDKLFYELCAWVVMPNHVHLLIQPKADLPVITRWLKGSTARGANQSAGAHRTTVLAGRIVRSLGKGRQGVRPHLPIHRGQPSDCGSGRFRGTLAMVKRRIEITGQANRLPHLVGPHAAGKRFA